MGQLWNILNRFSEKSKQSVDVSLDELYNYFKEMNEVEHEHIKIVINLNEFRIYWNHKIHSIL
jgi:Asp-tRNA(Asn)/Glu-tRNA(Gln) amidotransferase C subunit